MTTLEIAPFQIALDLERAGAIDPVGVTLPVGMELEQYENFGVFLGSLKRSASFWIGDWLIFGEASFGELQAQAIEATGLAVETLAHYRRVCEKVPRSRRRPGLSFGCHAAVADLPPAGQKRWLDKAEKNGWGTLELRKALQEADGETNGKQERIEGTDTPARRVDQKLVVEAAFAIVRDAQEIDDGYVSIPVETIVRLKAALGMETS